MYNEEKECEMCLDLRIANASLTRSLYEMEQQRVTLKKHITELRDYIYDMKKGLGYEMKPMPEMTSKVLN